MSKEKPLITRNWELVPYDFSYCWVHGSRDCPCPSAKARPGLTRRFLLGIASLCLALASACADFSVLARNNGNTTTTCIDRELADGDSCFPAVEPEPRSESNPPVLP